MDETFANGERKRVALADQFVLEQDQIRIRSGPKDDDRARLRPGERIEFSGEELYGEYDILQVAGIGGMGEVYLVRDSNYVSDAGKTRTRILRGAESFGIPSVKSYSQNEEAPSRNGIMALKIPKNMQGLNALRDEVDAIRKARQKLGDLAITEIEDTGYVSKIETAETGESEKKGNAYSILIKRYSPGVQSYFTELLSNDSILEPFSEEDIPDIFKEEMPLPQVDPESALERALYLLDMATILHDNGEVIGDLKPDNVMLEMPMSASSMDVQPDVYIGNIQSKCARNVMTDIGFINLSEFKTGSRKFNEYKAAKLITDKINKLSSMDLSGPEHADERELLEKLEIKLDKLLGRMGGRIPDEAPKRPLIYDSPHYLAPEMAKNLILGYKSDVYKIGVSLLQDLTGTRPFEGRRIRNWGDVHCLVTGKSDMEFKLEQMEKDPEKRQEMIDKMKKDGTWVPRKEPDYGLELNAIGQIALSEGETVINGYSWEKARSDIKNLIEDMTNPDPSARPTARYAAEFIRSRFFERSEAGEVMEGQWKFSTRTNSMRYKNMLRYVREVRDLNSYYMERFNEIQENLDETNTDIQSSKKRMSDYKSEKEREMGTIKSIMGIIDKSKERDTRSYTRSNLGDSLFELKADIDRREEEHGNEMKLYESRLRKDQRRYSRAIGQYRARRSALRKELLNYSDGFVGQASRDTGTESI